MVVLLLLVWVDKMLVRGGRAIKAAWADFTFTQQDNLTVVPRRATMYLFE
jgi:hypothetical protein